MPKDYIKYILRQSPKVQVRLWKAINKIILWDFTGLDCKKMKGLEGVYRARVGKFRIVFAQDESGEGAIVAINTRGDIY